MNLKDSLKYEINLVFNYKNIYLLATIILFLIISMIQYTSPDSSILYLTDIVIGLSYTKKIIILLCAYLGVTIFNKEIVNGYYKYSSIRLNFKNYSLGKSLSCFLFVFFTAFTSFYICNLILNIKYPWYTKLHIDHIIQNQAPDLINSPQLFIFFLILNFCLSITVWGQIGLLLSVFIDDSLAIIFSPYILSYVIENISLMFPKQISIYYLSRTIDVFKFKDYKMLIYPSFILLFLIAILVFINYKLILWRINGKFN